MKEPNKIRPIGTGHSSGEFDPYAGWLKNTPDPESLPEFDADWMRQEPKFALDARERAAVLSDGRKSNHLVQWSALAAILTIVVGGMIYYSTQVTPAPETTVEKAGDPTRAMTVFVQGKVMYLKPGSVEPEALFSGTVLEEGTRIQTGADARADLAFSKGSIIRINSDSELVVENMRLIGGSRKVGLSLENGSVLNAVDRLTAQEDYTVTTPTAIAGVRGTAFRIETDGKDTRIICDEGSIAVQSRSSRKQGERPVVLKARQRVEIQPEVPEVTVESAPGDPGADRNLSELRENLKSFDPEIVTATLELEEVKTEADIERIYQRDLETIILKDGRNLRGIVASQLGNRLIIQTASGQLVIPLEQVKEIYQD